MKALMNWFKRFWQKNVAFLACNYEDNYYGDRLCKCETVLED